MADATDAKVPRRGVRPPSLNKGQTDWRGAHGAERNGPELNVEIKSDPASSEATISNAPAVGRIDGRTLRRSGRTVQFATRVSPQFDERLRQIAVRDRLMLVEVLERALDAYERTKATAR